MMTRPRERELKSRRCSRCQHQAQGHANFGGHQMDAGWEGDVVSCMSGNRSKIKEESAGCVAVPSTWSSNALQGWTIVEQLNRLLRLGGVRRAIKEEKGKERREERKEKMEEEKGRVSNFNLNLLNNNSNKLGSLKDNNQKFRSWNPEAKKKDKLVR